VIDEPDEFGHLGGKVFSARLKFREEIFGEEGGVGG